MRPGGHKTPKQIKAGFPGFEQRVKTLLWSRIRGPLKERPDYDEWRRLITEWKDEKKVGRRQAVVNASLAFDCLSEIIADYDLTVYGVSRSGQSTESENDSESLSIPNDNIKQSYRENLRWAITAAGRFKRTGEAPKTCPNDAAYYLFAQAKEDARDFLSKVGQVEVKSTSQDEIEEDDRKQATRSIDEIDEMLATLDEEEENDEQ